MATTTNIPILKINYLSQAQYDAALANNEISSNELYFTPSDPNANTDTKVTQTVTTTNATYPILFSSTAAATATLTDTARFGTLISANPSLGRVAMRALVVGQSTTANYSGWTTTVPSSITNAQTGQVMFVVET